MRGKAKRLGQVFLINEAAAKAEAAHALGKVVLEIGPGRGILTKELCSSAKKVIAVEKDPVLYDYLRNRMNYENLKLINADFFEVSGSELELDSVDIIISNIPYYLSSRVIGWLAEMKKEAVLCMQKEFVEHMLARENSRSYSRLSVISNLSFSITEIMSVSRRSFRPVPIVDSRIIYIRPKKVTIGKEIGRVINVLMQHKKKTLRNAVIDACSDLGKSKSEAREIAEALELKGSRVFKLSPERILEASNEILKKIDSM